MHGSMAHPASLPTGKDLTAARRHGFLSKVAANALSLWRTAIGRPLARPLAKVRARQAALGFPFRSDPVPPLEEPDRDCDCVPLEWL
jgi:hypothetical protein